jgi:hypothetical protein
MRFAAEGLSACARQAEQWKSKSANLASLIVSMGGQLLNLSRRCQKTYRCYIQHLKSVPLSVQHKLVHNDECASAGCEC